MGQRTGGQKTQNSWVEIKLFAKTEKWKKNNSFDYMYGVCVCVDIYTYIHDHICKKWCTRNCSPPPDRCPAKPLSSRREWEELSLPSKLLPHAVVWQVCPTCSLHATRPSWNCKHWRVINVISFSRTENIVSYQTLKKKSFQLQLRQLALEISNRMVHLEGI